MRMQCIWHVVYSLPISRDVRFVLYLRKSGLIMQYDLSMI